VAAFMSYRFYHNKKNPALADVRGQQVGIKLIALVE
jgi:hypothetical protein